MLKNKYINILGVIGLFFLIFGIALATSDDAYSSDRNDFKNQLNISGFWEISPIIIDDSGGEGIIWTDALIEPWCSGSGTWRDPYLIENVTIDGTGIGHCIFIENSDVFFIIRNCTFYNSGTEYANAGIFLFNACNGKITNNTCYNNDMGIVLWGESQNNTVSNNIVKHNNNEGIRTGTELASNNNISENLAKFNYQGIQIEGENNTISNNKAMANTDRGIVVGGNSNFVTENVVKNNAEGIFSPFGQDIKILGNEVSDNDHGIGLHICNNILISENTVSNNIWAGIKLWISDK
jgi:parallel beta-helix repeat protein